MRILILGATGFIGSAIRARLAAEGHRIVGLARRARAADASGVDWRELDIARATDSADWLPLLNGIDAVINCAGVLQDSPRDSTHGVHVAGMAALYRACEQAGVRKVIHLSAVGVDREAPTEFSQSKRAGDEMLTARDLDWVILRPSVVIGRAAYGGSALLRALASLPLLPSLPLAGQLQPVYLDDVVDTVVFFLKPQSPSRRAIELVGPRRLSFDATVALLRRWLGHRPARVMPVPAWLAPALFRAGDLAGWLGWRSPVRSTAQMEMRRGATGDSQAWTDITGIVPQDIEHALMREPASVQERWFASLYILKPLIFVVIVAFWIATGLISLGPGWDIGMSYVLEGGLSHRMAMAAVISGALADIVIGLAIMVRPWSRYGLYAALLISVAYAVIGTILVPRLWADPLGPMLKIWPIMVLHLAALAILEDR